MTDFILMVNDENVPIEYFEQFYPVMKELFAKDFAKAVENGDKYDSIFHYIYENVDYSFHRICPDCDGEYRERIICSCDDVCNRCHGEAWNITCGECEDGYQVIDGAYILQYWTEGWTYEKY